MTKIRLTRGGSKRKPFYRIVVMDSRRRREGRNLEILGYYNPISRQDDRLVMKEDRILDWYFKGARASDTVYRLMKKNGLVGKITEARKLIKSGKTIEEALDQVVVKEEAASSVKTETPAMENIAQGENSVDDNTAQTSDKENSAENSSEE